MFQSKEQKGDIVMQSKIIFIMTFCLLFFTGCNNSSKNQVTIEEIKKEIYPQIVEKINDDLKTNQDELIMKVSPPEILEIKKIDDRYYVLYTATYQSKDKKNYNNTTKGVILFQELNQNNGKFELGSGSGYGSDELNNLIISGNYQNIWQYGLVNNSLVNTIAVYYNDGISIHQKVQKGKYYLILRKDALNLKVEKVECLDKNNNLLTGSSFSK